jgi:hypothetical protein
LFGHLTNFTLNKDNDNYINKEGIYKYCLYLLDFMNEDTGTKRLMTNIFKYLEEELDCDTDELWSKIQDVVIKVIIYNK